MKHIWICGGIQKESLKHTLVYMDLNVPLPPMQFDFVNNTWETFDRFLEKVDTVQRPLYTTNLSICAQHPLHSTLSVLHLHPRTPTPTSLSSLFSFSSYLLLYFRQVPIPYVPTTNRQLWTHKKYVGFECKSINNLPSGTPLHSYLHLLCSLIHTCSPFLTTSVVTTSVPLLLLSLNICSSVNRYPMHCRRTRDVDCYQHFTRQTRDQDISHHHVALVVVMLILPRHTRYNSRKTTTTWKLMRTASHHQQICC